MNPKSSKTPAHRPATRKDGNIAETARAVLSHLKPRRRSVIERLHGLWDGRIRTLSQLAVELGTSRSNCGLIRDRAYARIARDLDSNSPHFRRELKASYVRLLKTIGRMARQSDWEDHDSPLFKNNPEEFLALFFLRRASRTKLESLGETSEEGVYFDSPWTKSRYERTIAAVMSALEAHGRPLPLDDLLEKIGANVEEEFLRRCLELSHRCGLDESNMAARRSWPFFESKGCKELVHRALVELGRPASPAEILRTIVRLFPKRTVRLKGLISALAAHPEIFMRVGFRLHGLRAWGLARVPKQADFLCAELQRRGGKATTQELYAEGRRIHGFRPKSLRQTLTIHPERFRRSPEKVWELVSDAGPAPR